MKWKMTFALPIALAAGCVTTVTTQSTLQSWVGHSETELVSSWGAPNAAIDTRDGNRILTWDAYWGDYGQSLCRKSVTVDGGGTVVAWSYHGCPM